MITDRLVFFKVEKDSLVYRFAHLLLKEEKADALSANSLGHLVSDISEEKLFTCISELSEFGVIHGYEGNLWHLYLTNFLVTDENAYSISCEMRGDKGGTMQSLALGDMSVFRKLFMVDLSLLEKRYSYSMDSIMHFEPTTDGGRIYHEHVRDEIEELCKKLEQAKDTEDFKRILTSFYEQYGVGKLGLHKAFRINDITGSIYPVARVGQVRLDDLIGYEAQKDMLLANTKSFVKGLPANNCLLYGDAGTGKSTSIKAITNQFYKDGLRTIEIYKHQFKFLNDIIAEIKTRNYRFILYMDDLSFEEFETEYKYLKAVIEGGLEMRPENVLIYATSNRRHLIRETFADKADRDELHKNDTVQEKLSLYNRFGVSIYFGSPDKKAFNEIVLALKERAGLTISDEEILQKANIWEMHHGGLSGRTAKQFIDNLLGEE